MKSWILLLIVHISSYFLTQVLPHTCQVVYYITIVLFLIKVLNYFAEIPDPEPFNPIGKHKISPAIFYNDLKQFDKGNKYFKDDFTFQTEDGYNLLVFRVCQNDDEKKQLIDKRFLNKPVLFLHSYSGAATDWLLSRESYVNYFADKGFDCWFMNFRGNIFNLSHKNQDISYEEFFDFTYDDLGQKDVPTCIDNILKITKKPKLTLVSLSAGAFAGNIALTDKSTHKNTNSQVEQAIFLAPMLLITHHKEKNWDTDYCYYKNMDWAIKKSKEWKSYHTKFGSYHSDSYFCTKFLKYIDSVYPAYDLAGTDITGFDGKTDVAVACVLKKDLLWTLFPCQKFFGHPGGRTDGYGTSTKCFLHIVQQVLTERRYTKKLYAYHYGSEENKQNYGTEESPDYDLTNINIPMSLIIGSTDKVCNLEGSQAFADLVNTHNKNENLKCFCLENWRHASFQYPKDMKPMTQIFDEILG